MLGLSETSRLLPHRPPRIGELVEVRSRRWLVEAVEAPDPSASPRVSLACADDDAQGQTLEVYWDFEIDRRILEQEAWSAIGARGFDPPRYFSAFLHTLRWNCVTATDPTLFQSPFRAGIKIDAYQMEPLRKALRLPRVNLFIADDTGLGKTIEAGLIARELLLRKKARTLVVAAPASVLEQWKAEMEERFGLVFVILDRAYLTRVRQERASGSTRGAPTVAFSYLTTCSSIRPTRTPCANGWASFFRRASSSWTKPTTPHRRAAGAMGSRRSSPARSAISGGASSTACSCPRRPTTATPTPSPPCSSCSTLPLHPGGADPGQERARRRDGAAHQGGHPRGPGRLPETEGGPHPNRRPAGGCPGAGSLPSPRSIPGVAGGAPKRSARRAPVPPPLCSWWVCNRSCSPPSRHSRSPSQGTERRWRDSGNGR